MATKPADKFITLSRLATMYNLKYNVLDIKRYVVAAKIKPVASIPLGKREVDLYEIDPVVKVMEDHIAKMKVKAAERAAKKAPPKPAPVQQAPGPVTVLHPVAPDLELSRINTAIHGLNDNVGDIASNVAALAAELALVKQQNAVLLKAIEKVGDGLGSKFAEFMKAQNTQPMALGAVGESALSHLVITKEKPRVAIVGLIPDQEHIISKEFHDVFMLKFYRVDDAKGKEFIAGISRYDYALMMTRFVSHTVEDGIKASGTKLIHVSGGMSTLRDKLTELFINKQEKK